jgi:hypothetical protein
MQTTAPTNGVVFYATDSNEKYIRRANAWQPYVSWRRELVFIQTKLASHARFNFFDPGLTSTFVGFSRAAIVSDRVLCPNAWITSGEGRYIRRANYDVEGGFPPAEDPEARNDFNSLGDFALEREVLHYGGNGATWKLEMVPQLSHVGGLTGFQLLGAGGHVRARLTNMVDVFGQRTYPGLNHIRQVSGTAPAAVTVGLTGTMAGIASYHLQINSVFGDPTLRQVEFHIYINGVMAPGTCTIGATLALPAGWQWNVPPASAYMPMGNAYPLWIDVGLGNVSQEHAAISVDGRPIYTTGVLRDDILCLHLPGYSPPGYPQRTTERCDRYAYYSPNADVRKQINNDILPGIGKRVPTGVVGDKGFYPSHALPSVEPTDPEAEAVTVAVNDHGAPNATGSCKTVPFVKHGPGATAPRWTEEQPKQFAIVEVVVQRRPIQSGDFHVMPTLPDHPTTALTVQIGWYAVGEDGQFQSAGINIELAANVNVARWRGVLPVKTDRALVYDCTEAVNVTCLTADWDSATTITSATVPPMRAAYYTETQRLLQAI